MREVLKVLMIGNSFSDDTVTWAHEIASSIGKEIEVASLYIGGCSIDLHYSNALSDAPAYSLNVYNGTDWVAKTETTLSQAVKYRDWDIITFQQASHDSGMPESYENLPKLFKFVSDLATNKNVKYYFNMTWAYADDYQREEYSTRYGGRQLNMYNAILSAVKSKALPLNFDGVIPCGTAIQNARTSYIGDNFNRDGFHLSYTLGRFIAGLTLIATLLKTSILDVSFKPEGVLDDELKVAKEAVTNAIRNPFAITKSKYI